MRVFPEDLETWSARKVSHIQKMLKIKNPLREKEYMLGTLLAQMESASTTRRKEPKPPIALRGPEIKPPIPLSV